MEKCSMGPDNSFCPQALYLYGTYKEDGTPNFSLFCWFSYYFDGELGVMACIGGEKLTKDRIRAGKVFSANLVTEALLPVADYLGSTEGYSAGKMEIPLAVTKGAVLDVPVLEDSPWVFELEVAKAIPCDDGDVFLCKIRNTLAASELLDAGKAIEERVAWAAPVLTAGGQNYFSIGSRKGAWGDWANLKDVPCTNGAGG